VRVCAAPSQRQQQRNDTLTVVSLLAQCSSFLPAIISCDCLMQQLLAAACNPTAAPDAPNTTPTSLAVTVTAAPSSGATPSASNSSTLEADHNMQLLAWAILGSAAAKAEPAREAFVQAGLLQLLLDTAAFGCCGGTAVGSERVLCHAWLGRLAPEQLAASKQLAWSTLQQVGWWKDGAGVVTGCRCCLRERQPPPPRRAVAAVHPMQE
jgi:hypothetical protein